MAKHKLTDRKVDNAKPGKHEDGEGLRLVVSKSLAKKWVLRVTYNGKRIEMGLRSYPGVSLKEARAKAEKYRGLAQNGTDPVKAREADDATVDGAPTFTTCAARYIRANRKSWKNYKHRMQWVYTLKEFARPVIGAKSVDQVTTEDMLSILTPIWVSKTETAKRLQGRIENVLDYASALGYRDYMNPARWRGHLDKLLPKPSSIKKERHHPAMPYEVVPAFMTELQKKDSVSAKAVRFLILTACRSGEVLGATWGEVDIDAATWTIPPERMKTKKEHKVPLCVEALEVVNGLHREVGNPYLFPGARIGKPLSNMALLQLMRGMGYGSNGVRGDYVPHGFRSSFRDWSGEVGSFPRDVCEMALAHTIPNKAEAAYRRGSLFVKRSKMMQEWSDYLKVDPAEVVQMPEQEQKVAG
jgi:integrase